MSEESKMDTDYVHMGDGAGVKTSKGSPAVNLDDANLSQEDRDMRLAIALQQQENAAVYEAHKKRHEKAVEADKMRTTRSCTYSRLAAVRDKDHGKLSVPAAYNNDNAYKNESYAAPPSSASLKGATPQEIADHNLAAEIQKEEQVGAGTAQEMEKIIREEKADTEAQEHRIARHMVKRF